MRSLLSVLVLGALVVAGCAGHKQRPPATPTSAPRPKTSTQFSDLIVTPEEALTGKVVSFNPDGRFAVLSFPVGHLPTLDQRLMVYRQGLKVGEIKITGPQLDDNIVGDVVAGEARGGDLVRDQ